MSHATLTPPTDRTVDQATITDVLVDIAEHLTALTTWEHFTVTLKHGADTGTYIRVWTNEHRAELIRRLAGSGTTRPHDLPGFGTVLSWAGHVNDVPVVIEGVDQ